MHRTPTATLLLGSVLAVVACQRAGASTPSVAPDPGQAAAHAPTGTPAELPTVTVDDLAARIARHDNVAVFDANGHDSYLQRHIPGARFVAFDQVHATDLPADHATPLVFYCANEH